MRKLPKGWRLRTVDELFEVQLGKMLNEAARIEGSQYPYLTNTNVQWAKFRLDALNKMHFSPKEREKFSLKAGDLIVCEGGEVGRCAIWKEEISPCYFQKALHRLRPKGPLNILSDFMMAYMKFIAGTKLLGDLTTQSSIAHLTRERLLDLVVNLPPLPEQRKIADILGTWDEALEKLDALIAAKERRKSGLMQQLLAGPRGQSKSPAWKRVSLSEVAEECSVRNREKLERGRLYAVTKADGMVPMRENVQGATIHRCQIVEQGWFAYNPMRINIGSIARWEKKDPVMVSPDYVVFRANEKRLLSDYLNHLRRASPWADFVGAAGNGSVRVRIWFDDLGRFEFPLPSLEEQRAIARVLDAADTELRVLRQQRAALDQQKRGLMQQLLTGKRRVKP